MMNIDLTINLGHLLTLGGLLITAVIGAVKFDGRLKAVEKAVETLAGVLVQTARIDERVGELAHRLDRLDGGRGGSRPA